MSKKRREQKTREEQRARKPAKIEDLPESASLSPTDEDNADGPLNELKLPPPFVAERALRDLLGGGEAEEDDAQAQAQHLAYEALEAQDAETAGRLAGEAVELDPGCLDALTILAQLSSDSTAELADHLRKIVAIGEQDFGVDFFRENRGHFWGLLETRPYMRARAYLAQLLVEAGRPDEAIREYEALLDLNPNDNQGLRYALLGCYLNAGSLAGVRRLFEDFEDEGSAMFAWGRVLERCLAGDEVAAGRALKEARDGNPHVEKYLTGRQRLPRRLPQYYGIGDENEAIICADTLAPAWKQHPQAAAWLGRAGRV